MTIPSILTAAAALLAPGDSGVSYDQDTTQTVQTVVIPEPSTWKVIWSNAAPVPVKEGPSLIRN